MNADGSIRLRAMRSDDLDAVAEMEKRLNWPPWTRAQLAESLCLPRYACHVALHEDQPVGYLIATHGWDLTDLLIIGVNPAFQRRRIATTLILRLAALTALRKGRGIFLEVRQSNSVAIGCYQRLGFETVGRRKGYYPASLLQTEKVLVSRFVDSPRSRRSADSRPSLLVMTPGREDAVTMIGEITTLLDNR
jgi:ribosomal-protein-alanine N-acetyltransferase